MRINKDTGLAFRDNDPNQYLQSSVDRLLAVRGSRSLKPLYGASIDRRNPQGDEIPALIQEALDTDEKISSLEITRVKDREDGQTNLVVIADFAGVRVRIVL